MSSALSKRGLALVLRRLSAPVKELRRGQHVFSCEKFMTRSQSREQAFALLFEKSFNPETDMEDIIAIGLENELIEQDEFASMLAQTAWDKLYSIDSVIEKYSKNWKKHRISRVALSALRLSVCEMLYIPDIPVGVSVNEAVELCKKYATAEDAAFVNGILGAVARGEQLAQRNGQPGEETGE